MDHQGAIEHILSRLEHELPVHLSYHGLHHTLDVLESVERIARYEKVPEESIDLLLVAAAYHDSGFIFHHKDHEEKGCKIVHETLPSFGFDAPTIEQLCKMIMATKVPQTPTGELSDILCDADLDYLGRDDFQHISRTLFKELETLHIVTEEETWNRIQVDFLKKHYYHTDYGKTHRQPKKQEYLKELETLVANYDS